MYRIWRVASILLMAGISGLIAAAQGFGQACRGIPTRDGQVDVRSGIGLAAETIRYGGDLGLNLPGPLALRVGYTRIAFDEEATLTNELGIPLKRGRNDNVVSGEVVYELPGLALSVCPTGGIHYGWGSEDGPRRPPFPTPDVLPPILLIQKFSQVKIPVGLGVGKALPVGPSGSFTAFAKPEIFVVRHQTTAHRFFFPSGDVGGEIRRLREVNTSVEFESTVGAVLAVSPQLYWAGDLTASTLEEDELVVSLRLGVMF